MDMQKTGLLIRRLREARGITQKALAEKLHVTDKAVSKWERSLSCPDVALLEPLAGQLGISVAELLQGELFPEEQPQRAPIQEKPFPEFSRSQRLIQEKLPQEEFTDFPESTRSPDRSDSLPQHTEHFSKQEHSVPHALQPPHASHRPRALHTLQKYASCACIFLFCMGGGICAICDLAVFGAFTWSLYPIASLIFTWAVLSPLLRRGKKGIRGSLISLSLTIFPFLFALAWLLHRPPLFLPVSFSMAVIGLAFLWGIYSILRQFTQRKMFALALCSLLAVFVFLAVNLALSRLLPIPFLDEWDVLTIAVFFCLAIFFVRLDQKMFLSRQRAENTGKTASEISGKTSFEEVIQRDINQCFL